MPDGAHLELKRLASGRGCLAIRTGHGLRERSFHDADHACPVARLNSDRVRPNASVGRKDEHRLQLLNVRGETLSCVSVRVVYEDIFGMALGEPLPFLIGVNVEIQRVESCEVLAADSLGLFVSSEL